ncbi:penicillin-binding protein 1A [Gudongella sp. DL1XJH-153]|uniref:penicillin-binding protein 1A n=1 Tax=Gudongella sp. DL1XJH-153 TaxID=3409804 RepID=UPI003BB6C538
MSTENKRKRKQNKFTIGKAIKILLVMIIIAGIMAGGAVGAAVVSILDEAPEIDPTTIVTSLAETSSIYDLNGNLIEKIQAEELRTVVSIKEMPQHLVDAFIAIEDHRFEEHPGVDIEGIMGALVDNLRSGGLRGASTITQQLVKNVYLSNEVKLTRKITEAYLALKVETILSKDQILEAYLNRNYFGQNAYGVQEASRTYFSKNVQDLTIAESALLAGVVKSTTQFQPYYRVKPGDFDPEIHYEVGQLDVLGETFIAVFNEDSINRQRLVLDKMLEQEKITESQYQEAIAQDIKSSLNPEEKKPQDITSYFADYVKTQVVEALVDKKGYTREQAEIELFTGGLTIYATIDMEMQKQLENIYTNFVEILVGNTDGIRGPVLVDWRINSAGNVIDDKNEIVYFSKDSLMTEDNSLILQENEYQLENGNLIINTNKINFYPTHFDIVDYYTIDDKKNLVSHSVGSIVIPEGQFSVAEGVLTIDKSYLDNNPEFYQSQDGRITISNRYFYVHEEGVVQPQSATVVLDYKTGHIKALVGGRDIDGSRILNRATASARQPGSAIKPVSTYWPALASGMTAATAIDDIPFYDGNGTLWPKNWYNGYRGIHTLRRSVEQSVNVNAVKTVQNIGVATSISYLEKMGIINKDHPERDNFVTSMENRATNDENLSALGLGGMTNGLSPLELTAAYGAIANDGVFIEPVSFSKILDKNGNVLLDNTPEETIVTSPQVAYIMGDILRTTVSSGIAGRARMSNMAVSGKTGTTQNQADIWFVGYTPYYVSGTWIGNDSPRVTLSRNSSTAAQLWQYINNTIHEGLESKTSFDRPDGIVSASICTQSGLLATNLCSNDPRGVVRTEIFASGTVPKAYCDMHVEVKIDVTNGKIANEYCPDENVATRVFIERSPLYNPDDHNGIVPSDYNYQVPTEVCDDHNENTVIENPVLDWLNEWFENNEGETPPEEMPPSTELDDDPDNNGNGNGNGNSDQDDTENE